MAINLKPRSSPEAERAIIGSILIDNAVFPRIRDIVEPEHFYEESVRLVYKCVSMLSDKNTPVDIVTLSQRLRDDSVYDAVGGTEFLARCIDDTVHSANAEYYAKIVTGLYLEREIVTAARALAIGQESTHLERVREMVLRKERLGGPAVFSYETGMVDMLDRIIKPQEKSIFNIGIKAIDAAWMGCKRGEVNTWGAATNTGKSLMLLNLAHQAATAGHRCLYVGTEMSATETVQRHLSIVTAVEPWKIRLSRLSGDDARRLHDAMADRLNGMPLAILDSPEPSIADVEGAIIAAKADVVFLDYLERFKLPRAENFRLRVSEFMRQLKNMARRHGVLIHLASQLSRMVYGRDEARPTMADLSESSGVEKESDRVVLLWTPKKKQTVPNRKMVEAILAKNRHGKRGMVIDLELDELTLRITEAAQEAMIDV